MNGNRKSRECLLVIALVLNIFIQVIIAAPTVDKPDNTKEKVSYETSPLETSNLNDSVEDEEVIELEDLKYQNQAKEGENLLPVLEKLLAATEDIQEEVAKESAQVQDSDEDSLKKLHYTNPHHHLQQKPNKEENSAGEKEKPIKTFRGAARLTYGQHPENDNDHTTTTTTTPSPPPTTTTTEATTVISTERSEQEENTEEIIPQTTETLTNNGQRRSLIASRNNDNAEVLLRHSNGQYSAFDVAQYIFWTGDEEGVARAVEELIEEGLMSREKAIKFLHDIRLGIVYLENTYSLKDNTKDFEFTKQIPLKTSPISTSTSTTEQTTTEKLNMLKFNGNHLKLPNHERDNYINIDNKPTLSPAVLKAIEKLPVILKLAELNNKKDSINQIDYDDVNGRLRLADFLYAEYSLEEVIYQLAKTMFSQSLTHGSEQSQRALQRLTGFLEAEGSSGRISPALQKKILDVLLAALSDTLAENPELMNKARQALGMKI